MESYYLNQAGNGAGIVAFSGARYQRGGGFFSQLFISKVLPILKYLGEKALKTGKAVFDDFKASTTNRIIDTVHEVAQDAIKRKVPKGDPQSGSGIKRKRLTKRSYIVRNYDFLK